jgi:hypothetical protein
VVVLLPYHGACTLREAKGASFHRVVYPLLQCHQ